MKPKVLMSDIRSSGPMPRLAEPERVRKYLVSEVRIAVLERRFGFQADISSITKISWRCLW